MAKVGILYIHSMMHHGDAWQGAGRIAAEQGVAVRFMPQKEAVEALEKGQFHIVVAEITLGGQDFERLLTLAGKCPHRLGVSAEIQSDFTTFDEETRYEYGVLTARLSSDNYAAALLLLANRAGFDVPVMQKQEVCSCGIYHPEGEKIYLQVDDYLTWQRGRKISRQRVTAILFYYVQLVEKNLAEIDALIYRCEQEGLCPVAVFSAGPEDDAETLDWYTLLKRIPGLGVVVNCMAGRLLKQQQDTRLLSQLGVPVVQALRSYTQTPEDWQADPQGLPATGAVFSQTYPEMFGAIRPTLIAGVQKKREQGGSGGLRTYQPVEERVATLVGRLRRHFRLREIPARDKRLTIVLHNNPCKGVEATVGMAVGLDSFASLARLLRSLKEKGYDIGDCPLKGKQLLQEILEKKAIAEFRWTTMDELITKGGSLYMMGKNEYLDWFAQQPVSVRTKVEDDWGPFPGQGMAWQHQGEEVLVVTGLRHGNIQIINQPKRGCYGAKCTGEVCRILHDPNLSPPHHWFATYKYIRDTSDAVIHFGTEGALEYLPGKQNGLSGSCFSEISLGNLPNFYVYVMDAVGEGLVAKRRGQATLVDHLGPVFSPVELDADMVRLNNLLDQHSAALNSQDHRRLAELQAEIMPLVQDVLSVGQELTGPPLVQIDLARRRLAAMQRTLVPEGLHILGQEPSAASQGRLMATMLRNPPPGVESTDALGQRLPGGAGAYSKVAAFLAQTDQFSEESTELPPALAAYCHEVRQGLTQTNQEIQQLLHGLDGCYIAPGPAGSLAGGRTDLLPTGRNFYGKDAALLPTRAAHAVGKTMADALIRRYLEEEGRFPERVGMSLWSSDAFQSDGEQFSQILHLMGVQPCWDGQGKVERLKEIPLEQLQLEYKGAMRCRPRVDVTIATSGVMRDMVPHFCELLDQAVLLVSALDEPHEWNFIKKHTEEILAGLRQDMQTQLSNRAMRRMAAFRVFSSAPGTYGMGVGLALDASAWTSDSELAEIFINWCGHGLSGGGSTVAREVFARQLAGLDIASMHQARAEYDILDCACYAVAQGSMAASVRALAGHEIKLYWAETGSNRELCDVREQLHRSAAARLLNSRWINSMQEHGYQGAMAVSSRVNHLFAWSATTHAVPKELFDQVVETYIENEENRKWLVTANPYAMEEITRRLLEAASRGLWQAESAVLERVRDMALDIEGDMEEVMGAVGEDFQGGAVEVLGVDKVERWRHAWRIDHG